MREIKRNMARENMKRAGFVRINKKRNVIYRGTGKRGKMSFFAQNWRKWVNRVPDRRTV